MTSPSDPTEPSGLTRRELLLALGAAGLASAAGLSACAPSGNTANTLDSGAIPVPPPRPVTEQDLALLADLEQRSFRFFWETSDARTGLAPDRWPSPSFASVAAIGFALTAYPVGVTRGWITRAQARERVLTTLRFLHDAPQGPQATGTAGHKGFFYHFLDMRPGSNFGMRFGKCELSTVDTALLMAGVLFCQDWFDASDEGEIRSLAQRLYERIDWPWAQHRPPSICHGWHPESGFIPSDWKGYNEAMLVYLLALGSPTQAVGADAWDAWLSTYPRSWGMDYGEQHLRFGPLFGHQYTHCWVDFRGLQDRFLQQHGKLDYFENSRRAVIAQRAYGHANPMGWKGYSADVWGISACDGPADVTLTLDGRSRHFRTYAGRGMGGAHTYDDGTLAPTAAAASVAFAPELAIPAVATMHQRYGAQIYGQYGFLDAFNPSFDVEHKLQHGRRVPGMGWVDTDYLGIDQGPIVLMIANQKDDFVWRSTRRSAWLKRGLQKAGFTGGWLS